MSQPIQAPQKEALFCPVGNQAVASKEAASDYSDYKGVRYYHCCPGCKEAFQAEPEKYVARAAAYVRSVGGTTTPPPVVDNNARIKRIGNYQVALRVPVSGLHAEEQIDLEFRLSDTRERDAIEEGFKGVGGASTTATLTMPSMPGMPPATPKVHREGIPGDYGVELYFPHSGVYQLNLSIKIPNGGTEEVSFRLDVKDPDAKRPVTEKPYKLNILSAPTKAGKIQNLRMRIVDSESGKAQTKFDVAHERYFHLLLVSKDLNWFLHEHPTMASDGTWSVPVKFPAGTSYWVYADVAPAGSGSQMLAGEVKLTGAKPKWNTKLNLSTTSNLPGVKGILGSLQPISIGQSGVMQVKLFSTTKGKQLPTIKPWLGASGHMMIFHQDGQTVVHSHPVEGDEAAGLLKRGIVRFNARFPRAGTYKVYAQFLVGGTVKTFGFAIKVKA